MLKDRKEHTRSDQATRSMTSGMDLFLLCPLSTVGQNYCYHSFNMKRTVTLDFEYFILLNFVFITNDSRNKVLSSQEFTNFSVT